MGGETNQQMYTNSYPQYDIDTSYHGYDLSRDVSEYKFDGHDNIDPTTLAVGSFLIDSETRALFWYEYLESTCANTEENTTETDGW